MDIKVLGTGCPKCRTLEKLTRDAVEELGLDANISKVEDIMEIMQYNVARTPALIVDGNVVLKGSIPSYDALKKMLS
ncbi:MAG: thioredoxin family protein [Salinivirgaceae bacterium]|jgi:small redox-active disulfide protein 2|nr:thioredoxin family protein [Salinivirgaceae bacterium]